MIKIIIFALAMLCVICLCLSQRQMQKSIDEMFTMIDELMSRKDDKNDTFTDSTK